MSLTTPDTIRTLQRKLYAKAKQEPAYRFYALYDNISREDILSHAWRLVRFNRGSPVKGSAAPGLRPPLTSLLPQNAKPIAGFTRNDIEPILRSRHGHLVEFLTNEFKLEPGLIAFLYSRRLEEEKEEEEKEKCFDT